MVQERIVTLSEWRTITLSEIAELHAALDFYAEAAAVAQEMSNNGS